MDINPEIRERILTAAQQLFESSGRLELPTVDAVRRRRLGKRRRSCAVRLKRCRRNMPSSCRCSKSARGSGRGRRAKNKAAVLIIGAMLKSTLQRMP